MYYILCLNQFIYESLVFSIIGLPPEEDWPLDIPLTWDAFQKTPSVPLERLIPEIEPHAKDLLQVF